MSAPHYRDRVENVVVEAIRFVQAEGATHWHVNFGHPVAEALQDQFWVLTDEGAEAIADGDYVVQYPRDGARPNSTRRRVVRPEDFAARYDVIPLEAVQAARAKVLAEAIGGGVTVTPSSEGAEPVLIVGVPPASKRPFGIPKSVDGVRVRVAEGAAKA